MHTHTQPHAHTHNHSPPLKVAELTTSWSASLYVYHSLACTAHTQVAELNIVERITMEIMILREQLYEKNHPMVMMQP